MRRFTLIALTLTLLHGIPQAQKGYQGIMGRKDMIGFGIGVNPLFMKYNNGFIPVSPSAGISYTHILGRSFTLSADYDFQPLFVDVIQGYYPRASTDNGIFKYDQFMLGHSLRATANWYFSKNIAPFGYHLSVGTGPLAYQIPFDTVSFTSDFIKAWSYPYDITQKLKVDWTLNLSLGYSFGLGKRLVMDISLTSLFVFSNRFDYKNQNDGNFRWSTSTWGRAKKKAEKHYSYSPMYGDMDNYGIANPNQYLFDRAGNAFARQNSFHLEFTLHYLL